MRSLTKVIVGSQLHGTSTPTSDVDYKAVHVPNWKDILLGNSVKVIESNTKSDKTTKNSAEDIDLSSYSVSKFIKLLTDGDTSAVEMLLAPDQFRLETSSEFQYLYDNRFKLLNRKSKAFVGYVKSQSQKYSVKGSRLNAARDVLELLKKLGQKDKLGKYEGMISHFVDTTEHSEIKTLTTPSGVEVRHLTVCDKMAPFTITVQEAIAIFQPLYDNYGKRAQQAANNLNVDFKAVSHAYRIAEECIELLQTGNIIFPRPNAEYLKNIKLGKIPYSDLTTDLEELLDQADKASETSILPETSDMNFSTDTILKFHLEEIKNGTKFNI